MRGRSGRQKVRNGLPSAFDLLPSASPVPTFAAGPSRRPSRRLTQRFIILAGACLTPVPYAGGVNVARHFSDTRTAQGRVRLLLASGRVHLVAEGPGWHHASTHATLEDAATFLALLPELGQALYEVAVNDLERRAQLDGAA